MAKKHVSVFRASTGVRLKPERCFQWISGSIESLGQLEILDFLGTEEAMCAIAS
ncbi:hypothetical protein K0M31_005602 [Melipona bicolor]|uniref:Uncharacterized protein n=1 Tax=Melipona bicolor TaxID=60889 RepID=A0AA40FTT4_9HYME|nr:hypothetical protein K0M31_005602 [Melipona bicolor]